MNRRLQTSKLLILVLIALSSCARIPVVPMPTVEQLQAQERGAQEARLLGERVARNFCAVEIVETKRAIKRWIRDLQPLIVTLQRWDSLGEKPQDTPDEITPVVAQLAVADPMQRQCDALPKLLSDFAKLPGAQTPTSEELPPECDLIARRRAILERQFLASIQRQAEFPGNMFEIPKRYAEVGRVGWHTILRLQQLETEMARRKAWIAPAAKIVGLPILADIFRHGFDNRRALQREIDKGLQTLSLPVGVTDTQFSRQMLPRVRQRPEDAPMGDLPNEVLAVWPIDAQWQPIIDAKGKIVRRERQAAALLSTPTAQKCAVIWLRAEKNGNRTAPLRVVYSDDVRYVRCPRTAGK